MSVWNLIGLHLQANKVASYGFTDTGRRYGILGSGAKERITQAIAHSTSIDLFTRVLFGQKSSRSNTMNVAYTAQKHSLGNLPHLQQVVNELSLHPGVSTPHLSRFPAGNNKTVGSINILKVSLLTII